MMTNQIKAVTKDGKFVEWWQYSQGHFDVLMTDDPLKAHDFNKNADHCFDMFFRDKGYKQALIVISLEVKDGF